MFKDQNRESDVVLGWAVRDFHGLPLYVRNRRSALPVHDYDQKVAFFLNRDPLGLSAGVNLYAYVGNNTVNRTDPTGLQPPGMAPFGFGPIGPIMTPQQTASVASGQVQAAQASLPALQTAGYIAGGVGLTAGAVLAAPVVLAGAAEVAGTFAAVAPGALAEGGNFVSAVGGAALAAPGAAVEVTTAVFVAASPAVQDTFLAVQQAADDINQGYNTPPSAPNSALNAGAQLYSAGEDDINNFSSSITPATVPTYSSQAEIGTTGLSSPFGQMGASLSGAASFIGSNSSNSNNDEGGDPNSVGGGHVYSSGC